MQDVPDIFSPEDRPGEGSSEGAEGGLLPDSPLPDLVEPASREPRLVTKGRLLAATVKIRRESRNSSVAGEEDATELDESASPEEMPWVAQTNEETASELTEFLPAGWDEPIPAFAKNEIVAGRYRVEKFLARGGMGEVYRVEDLSLGGSVALKMIRPDRAAKARIEERFKREIQLARRVVSPYVCRIFDLGVHAPGLPESGASLSRVLFLTMELLEGETLAQRLKRAGPWPVAEALPIIRQMAMALDAAHREGIVHRDFKAANVMLVPGPEGERAVVTDFGLACVIGQDSDEHGQGLTVTGQLVGTPAYMAPEQVRGGEIGLAADIYALGVVAYEMVTGSRPFAGGGAIMSAVQRLVAKPCPPRSVRPELPARWDRVLLRCLEREPEGRFRSALEVIDALEGKIVKWSPKRRRRWRRLAAALMATVVVGTGSFRILQSGFLLELYDWSRADRSILVAKVPRQSFAVLRFQNLSSRETDGWLSTALGETLGAELDSARGYRRISGERVARTWRELRLPLGASLSLEQMRRLGSNLDADLVLDGFFVVVGNPRAPESDEEEPVRQIRLDARLVDIKTGNTVASVNRAGSESDLFQLVVSAGSDFRQRLGVNRAVEAVQGGARAAMPLDLAAVRLYAQGLQRLRRLEPQEAVVLLERAAEIEPGFPLIHSAQAEAWRQLGFSERETEAAKKAFELAKDLPREEELRIEGRYRRASGELVEAAEVYRTLFGFFPDELEYGVSLGEIQLDQGAVEEAEATLKALLRLPAPAREDPAIDLLEASIGEARGDFRMARRAAVRAAGRAEAKGAALLVARAKIVEAWAQAFLNNPERALDALESAEKISRSLEDRSGVATAWNAASVILSMRGRHGLAASKSKEAAKIFLEIGNQANAIECLENAAFDLLQMGNIHAAAAVIQRLENFQLEPNDQRNRAHIQYLRAWLETERGRPRKALALLAEVEEVWMKTGDKRKLAALRRRMGDAWLIQGNLALARSFYEEALQIAKDLKLDWYIAQHKQVLAVLRFEENQFESSQALAETTLEPFRKVGAAEREAAMAAVAARCRLRRGDPAGARDLLQRALALLHQIDNAFAAVAISIAAVEIEGATPENLQRLQDTIEAAKELGAARALFRGRVALEFARVAQPGEGSLALRLEQVAQEARKSGFEGIARKAAEMAGNNGLQTLMGSPEEM